MSYHKGSQLALFWFKSSIIGRISSDIKDIDRCWLGFGPDAANTMTANAAPVIL